MMFSLILAAGMSAQEDPHPIATAPPLAAAVASVNDTGVIPYPAAFFAEARPNNAFDMIQRLPGFTFNRGDAVRGFGGAAGNVLIDGERRTSKAVSLEDLLRRLPASSIIRIDLIRGGAPGVDMQGQPLVANIIRSTAAAQDLAATAGVRVYGDGWVAPQLNLEWSRRAGALSLEAAANYGWTDSPDGGVGARIRYFPSGALREQGEYRVRERTGNFGVNGSAELDLVENIWRLNAGVSREDVREHETVERNPATGPTRGVQTTNERRIKDRLELGGDYTRLISDRLQAQFIALQTLSRTASNETSVQPGTAEGARGDENEGESILRAVITARPSATLTLEGGAEGAFNFLDAANSVTANGVPVVLPNDNVRVEELRGEAFATASWKPSERLSVEAGGRFEASRISQSGDTNLARTFYFPKPRLLVAWAPGAASQLRFRFERVVSQLNFGDFVATADFSGSSVSAGGATLEPERAWVYEVAAERRFWSRGALVATYGHEVVDQVIDRIAVAGRFDAPGNIGDGRRDRFTLALTLPLDRLGIANGLITSQTTLRWSQVTDPVTRQSRRISREHPVAGQFAFSQDIARLSSTWGIEGRIAETGKTWRIDEIREQGEDSLWNLYWDWKPDRSLSLRAEFRNLNTRAQHRTRTRFAGSRALGVLSEIEQQDNTYPAYAYLRLRKAF